MIYSNITEQDNEVRRKIFKINNYMREKKISYELQFRIKQYLEYYLNKQNTIDEETEEIIGLLN